MPYIISDSGHGGYSLVNSPAHQFEHSAKIAASTQVLGQAGKVLRSSDRNIPQGSLEVRLGYRIGYHGNLRSPHPNTGDKPSIGKRPTEGERRYQKAIASGVKRGGLHLNSFGIDGIETQFNLRGNGYKVNVYSRNTNEVRAGDFYEIQDQDGQTIRVGRFHKRQAEVVDEAQKRTTSQNLSNPRYAQRTSPPYVVVEALEGQGARPSEGLTNLLTRSGSRDGIIPLSATGIRLSQEDTQDHLLVPSVKDWEVRIFLYGPSAPQGLDITYLPVIWYNGSRRTLNEVINAQARDVGTVRITLNGINYYKALFTDEHARIHMVNVKNRQYEGDITTLVRNLFNNIPIRIDGINTPNRDQTVRVNYSDGTSQEFTSREIAEAITHGRRPAPLSLSDDLSRVFTPDRSRDTNMRITGLDNRLIAIINNGTLSFTGRLLTVGAKNVPYSYTPTTNEPTRRFLMIYAPEGTTFNGEIATFVPRLSGGYPFGFVAIGIDGQVAQHFAQVNVSNSAPIGEIENPLTTHYNLPRGSTFVPWFRCNDPDGIEDIAGIKIAIYTLLGGPAPTAFFIEQLAPNSVVPRIRFNNTGQYRVRFMCTDIEGVPIPDVDLDVEILVTVGPNGSGSGTSGGDDGATPELPGRR